MNGETQRRATDAFLLEGFIRLNEAGAKQWAHYAMTAQSPELRRLLNATAQFEERAASDLKSLLPRVLE